MKRNKLFGLLAIGLVFTGCNVLGTNKETTDYNLELLFDNVSGYTVVGNQIPAVTNENFGTLKDVYTRKKSSRAAFEEEVENAGKSFPSSRNFDPQMYNKFPKIMSSSRSASDAISSAKRPFDGESFEEGDTYSFWVVKNPDQSNYTYEKLESELRSVGRYCYVWVDKTISSSYTDAEIKEMADKFDLIYPYEINLIGKNYCDNYYYSSFIAPKEEDKINILLFDIGNDRNSYSKNGIMGYFYGNDMYVNDESLWNGYGSFYDNYIKYSNQAQIFYIDAPFFETDKNNIYSTLSHEFNHMLNFVNKIMIDNGREENEDVDYGTWFTEMLSMSTEDVMQNLLNLADYDTNLVRLQFFNVYSEYGFSELCWNYVDASCSYANTYAFGAYLMRNYGGIKMLHELATSKYVNENAITQALKSLGYNESFDSVLKKFGQVFVNVDGSDTSLCSMYKDDTYTLNDYTYTIPKINLEKNYLEGYIDENGNPYSGEWYGPQFYSYEEVSTFNKKTNKYGTNMAILYSGFMFINFESKSGDWSTDNNIKNKNQYLSYILY